MDQQTFVVGQFQHIGATNDATVVDGDFTIAIAVDTVGYGCYQIRFPRSNCVGIGFNKIQAFVSQQIGESAFIARYLEIIGFVVWRRQRHRTVGFDIVGINQLHQFDLGFVA